MKKINLYIAGAAVAMLATACAHEDIFDIAGEGKLVLNASVSTDMKVVSRAVEQELQDSCMIWISNEKGLVRRYNKLNEVPPQIDLVTGHYVAEAWTGDSVSASWDDRYFKGFKEFDINAGQTTQVDLECKIANVGATVHYAEGIEEVLRDFSMNIGHLTGNLDFVGREERRGYFMMSSRDHNLAYRLTGKQIDGSDFVYEGVIEEAKSGYEYAINVNYTQSSTEVGGAIFSIVIDETEIPLFENDVVLIGSPKITGYGFDINAPVMGEQETLERHCVYVTSPTKVTQVDLNCDVFETLIPVLGGPDFELLGMNEVGQNAVREAGITYKYNYDETLDETIIQINFEKKFLDKLTNREEPYVIDITATDKDGRKATAALTFMISDAPVVTSPVGNNSVEYFTATLRGTASKEGLPVGFQYRPVSASRADEWSYVEGHYTNGLEFEAKLTGLVDNTTYEYRAVSDNFVSSVVETFTTLSAQLPNSGFEDWFHYNNKIWIPGKDYGDNYFWDSGNHGGATVSKNFTTSSTAYRHSGAYSACLRSEKVVIQFAAGNIFAGKYLKTDGTNGVLGWGRPFTHSPKSVDVWVKYEPVNVTDGGTHIQKGQLDQGIIYIALVDDTKTTYDDGSAWPCIVKTKTAELFDKDGSNVIAYGEYVFDKATDGSDMVLINIPLDYKKPGVTPSNIIFVASASRYGDYFEGGNGSTLYLDDIHLNY